MHNRNFLAKFPVCVGSQNFSSGCGQGARRYAYNDSIRSLYRVVRGGAEQSRAVSPPGLTLDGCVPPRTLLPSGPGIRPPSEGKRGVRGVPGGSLRAEPSFF